MNNCIKCQTSLELESKFCRRCGTEQIIESRSNETDTSLDSSQQRETAYTTKKMLKPFIPPASALATTPITQTIEGQQKRNRGLLIAGTIFLIMIMFGAVMTYAVLIKLNHLRSDKSIPVKKTVNKSNAKIEVLEPQAKTTPIDTEKQAESQSYNAIKSDGGVDSTLSPSIQKTSSSTITSPIPTTPLSTNKTTPTSVLLSKGQDRVPPIDSDEQKLETGFLRVKFRLVGKALVKIRGQEIAVIPLVDSSVMGVSRMVTSSLPNGISSLSGRQQATDPIIVSTIEKPSVKNNFTATLAVESNLPNINQVAIVDLEIRWQSK